MLPHPDEVLRQQGQAGLPFAVVTEVTLDSGERVYRPAKVQQEPVCHVRVVTLLSSCATLALNKALLQCL